MKWGYNCPPPPPRNLTATADIKGERAEMKAAQITLWFQQIFCICFYIMCTVLCFYCVHTGHACMLLFWAPVQWFCLLLWVHGCNSAKKTKQEEKKKKNTLWVLLFDATIILVEMFPFVWTPPCVIKVPLCISSPSLSENLSCTLMRVCWWVWLIVGFALQMSCVPAVTLRPIVWRSLALLLPSLSSHLPVWQINEGRLSSFRTRASF